MASMSNAERIVVTGFVGGPYAAAGVLAAEQLNCPFFNTYTQNIEQLLADDKPPEAVSVFRREFDLLQAGWKQHGKRGFIAALRAEALADNTITKGIRELGGMSVYVHVPEQVMLRRYLQGISDGTLLRRVAKRSFARYDGTAAVARERADHTLIFNRSESADIPTIAKKIGELYRRA